MLPQAIHIHSLVADEHHTRRVQGLYEAGHLVEVCMRREADGIYAHAQGDLHAHLMLTRERSRHAHTCADLTACRSGETVLPMDGHKITHGRSQGKVRGQSRG